MSRFSSHFPFLFLCLLFLHTKACHPGKVNLVVHEDDSYSPSETRILASVEKKPIRIAAFYFLDNAPKAVLTILTEQIIPGVIAYYQAALKVVPSSKPLSWSEKEIKSCTGRDVDVPKALTDGVDADLVFLFTGGNLLGSPYLGTSSPCDMEKVFKRPNLGHIDINYVGVNAQTWEDRVFLTYFLMHEIGHTLGFLDGLYEHYYNPATGRSFDPITEKEVNGQTIKVLNVEPLTKRLKKHFNCPTLEGAYLENQSPSGSTGSANHHFERRLFMNDVLSASTLHDTRISEFYLAVLEGSGWYSVDYDMAEPFTWGKNQGCNFFDKPCVKDEKSAFPDMFCMPLETFGCTNSLLGYGVCGDNQEKTDDKLPSAFNYFGGNRIVFDIFADNCPYYYPHPSYACEDPTNTYTFLDKEYFGSGSSCFTGNLKGNAQDVPYCFKRTCVETSSNKYRLVIEIGDQSVTCTKKESVSVSGYSGKLNCPDPTSYCKATEVKYCPRGCMGRGKCVSKKCRCYNGYSGTDCGIRSSNTMKEGTLEYLENFPGYASLTASGDKPKTKISLRVMSVIIGVGIIGATVVVALTLNKIRDLKLNRDARKRSKVDYKISHGAPDHVYNFDAPDGVASPQAASLQSIQMGVIEAAQSPTNAAAIRQEALRDYFAPPIERANVDKLAVLRGYRS